MLGEGPQRKKEVADFDGKLRKKSRDEPSGKVGRLKRSLGVQLFTLPESIPDQIHHKVKSNK